LAKRDRKNTKSKDIHSGRIMWISGDGMD